VFRVSAISGKGTTELGQAIMRELEAIDRRAQESEEDTYDIFE
jgi:uncharacterized protein YegL